MMSNAQSVCARNNRVCPLELHNNRVHSSEDLAGWHSGVVFHVLTCAIPCACKGIVSAREKQLHCKFLVSYTVFC